METETPYERHVLVAGGAGFVGSHFLDHVVSRYPHFHFTCIDKLNYASEWSTKNMTLALQFPNFRFVEQDLAVNLDLFKKLLVDDFSTNKITTIFNFAAESSVDRSFAEPLQLTANNIGSAQNLLECVRILLAQRPELLNKFLYVHISTDEVYGEQEQGCFANEEAQLSPSNPYSASKAAVDLLLQSYQKSFNIPAVIVRPNNIYGLRQHPEKLIPMVLSVLKQYNSNDDFGGNKARIRVHGNGRYSRTYLHVSDFISALDLIWEQCIRDQANRPDKGRVLGEVINVGTTDEIDNLSLIKYMIDIYFGDKIDSTTEIHSHLIEFVKDRHYNDFRYALNCDKIKALGWSRSIELKQGLQTLIKQDRG